jgi:amino acid transporter
MPRYAPIFQVIVRLIMQQEFGGNMFGPAGKIVYSVAIAISAFGALNSNIFATSRLCVVASNRLYFPALFGRTEENEDTTNTTSYLGQWLCFFPNCVSSAVSRISGVRYNWEKNEIGLELVVPVFRCNVRSIMRC